MNKMISGVLFCLLVGVVRSSWGPFPLCAWGKISCGDGSNCLSAEQLCDLALDCVDGSDESYDLCSMIGNERNHCSVGEVYCKAHYYRNSGLFRDNVCINLFSLCIAYKDKCKSGTDIQEICSKIENGVLMKSTQNNDNEIDVEFEEMVEFLEDILDTTTGNESDSCPAPYEKLYDECIMPHFPLELNWEDAKIFCETMNGRLASIKDIVLYGQLLEWLDERNITFGRFWLDGRSHATEGNWLWSDGEPIKMGAPFWAVRMLRFNGETFGSVIEPVEDSATEGCLAIASENYFYFSSEDCSKTFYPLCMTDHIQN